MTHHCRLLIVVSALILSVWICGLQAGEPAGPAAIVAADGSFAERLAAKEIRRYVYVTTGELLPIVSAVGRAPQGGVIVVAAKDCDVWRSAIADPRLLDSLASLAAEQYLLKTFEHDGAQVVIVAGGDPVGALYGAYRLAEHLGVRFYLHGDVVPDRRAAWRLPRLDERGEPLFGMRGIQPFHDFPEGPDWWDADQYKAIFAQLPKMRMNFFGLHTYPEGNVGPEPTVWIGSAGDVDADGAVRFSYPARHFTTRNAHWPDRSPAWGYQPMKTSDYSFGAAEFYAGDEFGPDYMAGLSPWTEQSNGQSNELFQRMGRVLDDVFSFGRRLGIKTCIGTETPLVIPTPVEERLKAAGKDPADPAVVREVYEGMFQRIARTHPLDYYWFWTPENWTWRGATPEQVEATLADFRAAIAAAEKVAAPFTLATCGWVLGPPQDPSLFDTALPKTMPMSCINRQVGHAPVEMGFAGVEGRPKWAIPWLEDDPAMVSPQLWVGRMRQDAADALAYGCTGLLGIHWRTRILGPNVSALAKAAWDQGGWKASAADEIRQEKLPATEGPVAGKVARFANQPMAGTEEEPLYQSVRYGMRAYRIDVPDGSYSVTLKFCEPAKSDRRQRVFAVEVQGRLAADQLDVFQRVGKNRACDVVVEDIKVTEGHLVIDFIPQVEYPCIAAIVAQGPAATRKINCGGPAWRDYQADWPAAGEAIGKERFLPCADFYADWAASQFGPEVGAKAAALFEKLDGRLPRTSEWVNGPGGIKPDSRPWEEVGKEYGFVDELAALRPQVRGAGNLERFDYWLDQFRYMRANGRFNCTLARFNAAMARAKAEKDAGAKRQLARETVLPIRRELVADLAELHKHLLASVGTYGGLGNVTNWQQHVIPMIITAPGQELAEMLGEPLPSDCLPSKTYQGPPRLLVPTVRTGLVEGERLVLRAVVVGGEPNEVAVFWRPLAGGGFSRAPMERAGRGVYEAALPARATADLEYYVEASGGGKRLVFPPTAPDLNQTVVVATAD